MRVKEGCIAKTNAVSGAGSYPYVVNYGILNCWYTGAPSTADEYFLHNFKGKATLTYFGSDDGSTENISYTKGGETNISADVTSNILYNYLEDGAIVRMDTNNSPGQASANVSPNTLTSSGIYWES